MCNLSLSINIPVDRDEYESQLSPESQSSHSQPTFVIEVDS